MESLSRSGIIHGVVSNVGLPVFVKFSNFVDKATVQGSAKRLQSGCVNAAGKLRQKW